MLSNKILLSLIVSFCVFIAGCSHHPAAKTAQGYVEGKYTYIATSVSGRLKELRVDRGAIVQKDQLLFVLEEQPESDAYQAAQEKLRESVAAHDAIAANLNYAKITYERYKLLVPKNAIDKASLDNAKSLYEALRAQLNQANANITENKALLAQSRWTKEQKNMVAPVSAIVFDTYYREGEYTEANKPILSLLAPADIKIIFYVTEPELGGLRLGNDISMRCDGCTQSYQGKISFISPSAEYTPPIIYSQETSYKLIYRIEARIDKKDALDLHPGQPMMVTYYPAEQSHNASLVTR
ncbi:MAG: HlyD family efflux transporter periplasmic adaptor subunit [Gammaproteobacteria bacterium]|nr:HlyD family efflux transporter periplasmic adaptor subunit [Gammaproteobacteria bacterium]